MTAQTLTLTDFLLARIEEDEERAGSGWSRRGDTRWERTNEGQSILTPGAVLAECEAKRRIVEAHYFMAAHESRDFGFDNGNCVTCRVQGPCTTLRFLALPYADHPDYRDEWRP